MERWRSAYVPADHSGAALTSQWLCRRGSSLVEVLTSMLFVSILSAMSYSFTRVALRSARIQEVKSEAQEVTVMALDVLSRDLRAAGFSATAAPVAGVRSAGREHVEVACDLDGNGDTAGANELIAYSYSDLKHQLMRATGGTSPQPFVFNVPSGGVRFSYFDADGREIPTSAGDLTAQQCRRIHRIDVQLRVEIPNPSPDDSTPLTSTVSSSICLRNQ